MDFNYVRGCLLAEKNIKTDAKLKITSYENIEFRMGHTVRSPLPEKNSQRFSFQ
jgi:hypothetical protein